MLCLLFLQGACTVDVVLSGLSIFPRYTLTKNQLSVTGQLNLIDKRTYEVGIIYSFKRQEPTIKKDTHQKIATIIKKGSFQKTIELNWNTVYYVRVYVNNKKRIFYTKPERIFVGANPKNN